MIEEASNPQAAAVDVDPTLHSKLNVCLAPASTALETVDMEAVPEVLEDHFPQDPGYSLSMHTKPP